MRMCCQHYGVATGDFKAVSLNLLIRPANNQKRPIDKSAQYYTPSTPCPRLFFYIKIIGIAYITSSVTQLLRDLSKF